MQLSSCLEHTLMNRRISTWSTPAEARADLADDRHMILECFANSSRPIWHPHLRQVPAFEKLNRTQVLVRRAPLCLKRSLRVDRHRECELCRRNCVVNNDGFCLGGLLGVSGSQNASGARALAYKTASTLCVFVILTSWKTAYRDGPNI
jgi:hypothetical protein